MQSYKVYDEAVARGHFRSRYQRSLYNVDSLRGKEFWTPKGARYAEAAKVKISSKNNDLCGARRAFSYT